MYIYGQNEVKKWKRSGGNSIKSLDMNNVRMDMHTP